MHPRQTDRQADRHETALPGRRRRSSPNAAPTRPSPPSRPSRGRGLQRPNNRRTPMLTRTSTAPVMTTAASENGTPRTSSSESVTPSNATPSMYARPERRARSASELQPRTAHSMATPMPSMKVLSTARPTSARIVTCRSFPGRSRSRSPKRPRTDRRARRRHSRNRGSSARPPQVGAA